MSEKSDPEIVGISGAHPLSMMDPKTLELPSANWTICKLSEKSLLICEVITAAPESPRVRKHVNVNVTTGQCVSFVMDRMVSDMPAVTKIDVEQCVDELHMMHACVGGPPASKYPPTCPANARVDPTGNWRHSSCKIIAPWTGVPCNACESLEHDLSHLPSTSKQKTSKKSANGATPKRINIGNLSHRKQSQITALRKRRTSWYRKKRNAEKEMKMIEDMIVEISEEPEANVAMEQEEEEEDDDDY